ncbi:MAG: hypothetical protein FJW30_23385 [Acidobacteria bacterium]|nr:hypothetical protein [Acidobacteriota bacterium]
MKRIVAGLALVAAGVIFGLPYAVVGDRFRPLLAEKLSTAAGKPVALGEVRLRVVPLSLRVENVRVEDLGAAESIAASVRLLPLLQGKVEIDSLVIRKPAVSWPLDYKPPPGEGQGAAFNEIRIEDGSVGRILSHIDVVASNVRPGASFPIEMTLRAGGKGTLRYKGSGGASWIGAVEASGFPAALLDPSLKGEVTGTAELRNLSATGAFDWKEYMASPISVRFDGGKAGETINLRELRVTIGKFNALAKGSVTGGALDGDLQIRDSPVETMNTSKAYRVAGTMNASLRVSGTTKSPRVDGPVSLSGFRLSGGAIREPLSIEAVHLHVAGDRVEARPFTLTTGPTTVRVSGTLSNVLAVPVADIVVESPGSRLEDLAALAKAYGAEGVQGKGTLAFRARMTGRVSQPAIQFVKGRPKVSHQGGAKGDHCGRR